MEALKLWGWNEDWARRFTRHAEGGWLPGRISVEHRGLYHYHGPHGEGVASVSGRLRHLAVGRADFPAVGDWVALRFSADAGPAVIEAVLARTNKLSRKSAGESGEEQLLAANLDVLFLVSSLNLDLNPSRLERFLAAAALPGCQSVLLLTKSDLCDSPAAAALDLRARLGDVPVHAVSALTGENCDELQAYLGPGRTVSLLGSSGVGKSTLINRLLGREVQRTREVRESDDRGRHATTHRELFVLPGGGLVIDTPGLREIQLWEGDQGIESAFADVESLAESCRFADCRHRGEPGFDPFLIGLDHGGDAHQLSLDRRKADQLVQLGEHLGDRLGRLGRRGGHGGDRRGVGRRRIGLDGRRGRRAAAGR